MEGVCIYRNFNNNVELLAYKEWEPSIIFYVIYINNCLTAAFINSKNFTNFIPKNCIHILTKLPINKNSINTTLNIWKSLIKTQLLIINNRDKYKL